MTENNEKQITRKELKSNLVAALKNSGALNSVKAQLRKEFIESISKSHSLPKTKNSDITLKSRILHSIVYHFLRSRHLQHSASVYSAETGLDSSTILSERDVVNGLGIGTETSIYKAVNNALSSDLSVSVYEQLIDESCARFRVSSMTTCTQTDVSGPGVREALESQMRDIRVSYLHRREAERLLPTKTIEERMITYQRECEERFRKDLDMQVQHIRDVEVARVRIAEQQRLHMELTHQQEKMEAEYQRKLQAQAEREKETVRLFSEKERQLQQMQYETRQQMQREMDDLRHREQMMKRKCDLEHQGLKVLEGRLKESQINIEAREREVARRERDCSVKFDEELTKCRKEAEAVVQMELDRLQGERIQIEMDKKRCSEESKQVGNYQSEIAELRIVVRDLKMDVSTKEDEILTLKHHLSLAQRAMTLENADTTDLLRGIGVDEDVTKGSRVDQIICLIRRNVEVEARVLQLEGYVSKATEEVKQEREARQSLEDEIETVQQELQAAKILLREKTESVSESEKSLRAEIAKYKKELSDEKSKTSLMQYECQQLEKLLHEQRQTIANMRKRNVLRKSHDTIEVAETRRQTRVPRYSEAPLDDYNSPYRDQSSVFQQQPAVKSEPIDVRSSYKENLQSPNTLSESQDLRLADVPTTSRPPVHLAPQQLYYQHQHAWQPSPGIVESAASFSASDRLPSRSLTASPQTLTNPSSLTSSAQVSPLHQLDDKPSVSYDSASEVSRTEELLRAQKQNEKEAEAQREAERARQERADLERRQAQEAQRRLDDERREQQAQQERADLERRQAQEAQRRLDDERREQQAQQERADLERRQAQEAQRRLDDERREQQLCDEKRAAVLAEEMLIKEQQDKQAADLRQQEIRDQQRRDEEHHRKLHQKQLDDEREAKAKADAAEAKRLEEEEEERAKQLRREKEAREAQDRIFAEAEQRKKEAEAKRREEEAERERALEEEQREKERVAREKEDAAAAAAREKEAEEQRKKEEDAKAIQSAREKILARRQQKQQRETALPPEPEPVPFVATVNDNDISEIETFEVQSMSESSGESTEW